MKLRIKPWLKIQAAVVVAILSWCVWTEGARAAAANQATNALAATRTNSLFDPQTERLAPYLTFGLHKIELLQRPLFDIPLYQYLASFIYVFLAFLVSRLLDRIIGTQLKKWAERTSSQLDDLILQLLHGPIKVISFVILLHIGLRVFPWPGWFETFLHKGLHLIVALSLTYLVLRLIDLSVSYWKRRSTAAEDKVFDEQLLPIVRNSLKVFAVIVAVLLTLQNLGLNITSLIASLSIGGLALSLAAQDTLANLFGAVAVFADKPFRVGDQIKLDSVEGNVESIGMRSTRVRTVDGHLVTIPNKTVGNATITNVARRMSIRTAMNIGLTYDTNAEKLRRALQLLEEIYRSEPMTKDVVITFNKFADSALNIEVVHLWNATDQKAYLKGLQALNLRVKEAFDREGIEFAFPTQTIYVKETAAAAA